jgi:uncharacterized hydrophobic protein (TIGR00271 family)
MRQLIVTTSQEESESVSRLAEEFEAKHVFQSLSPENTPSRVTTVLHLANGEVEGFLDNLEGEVKADITLHPRPVVTLETPFGRAPDHVKDTQMRSPFEVFQEGVQSIGSMFGLVGYAILGGLVVWVGLYTNSPPLLVAAMLIAPFAGPAMNLALSSARGDSKMIWRSLKRYVGAVAVTVLVTYLLSLLFGLSQPTQQMIMSSKISMVAVLLPIAAGAAGALNLIQSQRDSLVSGAAVGVLVAAALAPPAGNLGMALALSDYQIARSSLFILALQLFAINVSGASVFRWHGINAAQALYERGRTKISLLAFSVSLLGLAGLMAFQIQDPPELERSSVERRISAKIKSDLQELAPVDPLQVDVTFLPKNRSKSQPVLIEVTVRQKPEASEVVHPEQLERRLADMLVANFDDIHALVKVSKVTSVVGSEN